MAFEKNASGGDWTGEATTVAALNKPFWVKVLSFDGTRFYSWAEYYPTATGAFALLPGGRSGTVTLFPFFEANGNALTINSFVLIRQAYFDPVYSWVYVVVGTASTAGGSSSLTVENLDGSGVTTNTTTIKTDQSTGLVSSNIGPNMAEIRIEWSTTNPTPTPIYPPVPDPTSGGGGTVTPPAGTTKLVFTPSSTETITSIAAGVNGQLLYLVNLGTAKVTLTSGASIRTPLGVDYDLQIGREIQLEYVSSISKWVFAHPTLRTGTEYGTDQITAGAGITITPGGDGSASLSAQLPLSNAAGDINWWKGPTDRWYYGANLLARATSSAQMSPTSNVYWAVPFYMPRGGTPDKIGIKLSVNAGAGTTAHLGIYKNANNPSGANGLYPTTLLSDVTIPIDGSGNTSAAAGTGALGPGLYWLIMRVETGAAPTMYALPADYCWPTFGAVELGGGPGQQDTQGVAFYYSDGTAYGALVNPFPGVFNDANFTMVTDFIPMIALKFSA